MNPIFAENLIQVLTSDHELTYVKEKKHEEKKKATDEDQNMMAKRKLERIVYFMLGLVERSEFSQFLLDLLLTANLIVDNGDELSLTVDGFKFMLEDISSQIHILLLTYIRMRRNMTDHLKLIFQLILSNNKSYRINEEKEGLESDQIANILVELKQIGLIYMRKKKRFYITQLMR